MKHDSDPTFHMSLRAGGAPALRASGWGAAAQRPWPRAAAAATGRLSSGGNGSRGPAAVSVI
jgi:hypothetical protein